jgi:hypothetical protein
MHLRLVWSNLGEAGAGKPRVLVLSVVALPPGRLWSAQGASALKGGLVRQPVLFRDEA